MQIHRSNESIKPILKQPRHDVDDLKTPKQQEVEREANIKNDKSKRIAQQSVDKTYEMMQKLVKNTEYNVSFKIDELGSAKQFNFTLKNSGELIASIPPDIAVNMADKAKKQTIGLLLDYPA
ncbi:flagellar protein FlaG [Bacillus sp. FJAT-45350]|uniref:flagellar protein FlaG n=1 Tax=Bacillus sp. FJAT-45350 TaxID=2011014 RepID=UPI000BB68E26|nr:flagellar protein FlaG [Bacillus sp. FJAT-45350]